jgi:hypothetical protein
MDLQKIRNALLNIFPYSDGLEKLTEENLGYSVYIGDSQDEKIKLDLFYTENFIAPVIHQDGLRLASLQDIAAMKMQAIVNSKRKKDFWDVHELLEYFPLDTLIQYGLQRNPYTLTKSDILNTLCDLTEFTELSNDNVVFCLKGKYWELIMDDLKTTAEQYRE